MKISGIKTREEYEVKHSEFKNGKLITIVSICSYDREKTAKANIDGIESSHGLCDRHFQEEIDKILINKK